MKLANVDKDLIKNICLLSDCKLSIKEKCLGNIKRYIAEIESCNSYSSITAEIRYIESKITPKEDKLYILINNYDYIIVSGKDLCNNGVKYYRKLNRFSDEYKNLSLLKYLKEF